MRKIFFILLAAALTLAASSLPTGLVGGPAEAACTNTPNLTLCKPARGDANWDTQLNNNFDTLDNAVTLTGTQTLTNKTIALAGALTGTGATVTTSTPVMNLTQTFNASAVTFVGALLNFTCTACQAASRLLDVSLAGSTLFSVRKDAEVDLSADGTNTTISFIPGTSATITLGKVSVSDGVINAPANNLYLQIGGATRLQLVAAGALINSSLHVGSLTSLTLNAGEIGMTKMTAVASAPGAAGAKIAMVCGTNAGTMKAVMYAGTSSTGVTVVDNVGAGVTGC